MDQLLIFQKSWKHPSQHCDILTFRGLLQSEWLPWSERDWDSFWTPVGCWSGLNDYPDLKGIETLSPSFRTVCLSSEWLPWSERDWDRRPRPSSSTWRSEWLPWSERDWDQTPDRPRRLPSLNDYPDLKGIETSLVIGYWFLVMSEWLPWSERDWDSVLCSLLVKRP